MQDINQLSKQRLDFRTGPNGEAIAMLAITLQDGSVHRFEASANQEDVDAMGAALSVSEARLARKEGIGEDEIGGLLSSVGSAFKKIGRKAQKIASSKVFKMAGKGLLAASPMLGPFAPAAAAVGGGMMAASALSDASLAAESKAKRVARALGKGGKKKGRRSAKKAGFSFKSMMRFANKRRKGAKRRAEGKRKRKRKRDKWGRPIKRKKRLTRSASKRRASKRRKTKKRADPVRAVARGRVRSNKPGGVTRGELARAAKRGRIFWVS